MRIFLLEDSGSSVTGSASVTEARRMWEVLADVFKFCACHSSPTSVLPVKNTFVFTHKALFLYNAVNIVL